MISKIKNLHITTLISMEANKITQATKQEFDYKQFQESLHKGLEDELSKCNEDTDTVTLPLFTESSLQQKSLPFCQSMLIKLEIWRKELKYVLKNANKKKKRLQKQKKHLKSLIEKIKPLNAIKSNNEEDDMLGIMLQKGYEHNLNDINQKLQWLEKNIPIYKQNIKNINHNINLIKNVIATKTNS